MGEKHKFSLVILCKTIVSHGRKSIFEKWNFCLTRLRRITYLWRAVALRVKKTCKYCLEIHNYSVRKYQELASDLLVCEALNKYDTVSVTRNDRKFLYIIVYMDALRSFHKILMNNSIIVKRNACKPKYALLSSEICILFQISFLSLFLSSQIFNLVSLRYFNAMYAYSF